MKRKKQNENTQNNNEQKKTTMQNTLQTQNKRQIQMEIHNMQKMPKTEGKYVGRTEGASIELIERRSTLQEFDRTQCVKNCNDLYIQITKK